MKKFDTKMEKLWKLKMDDTFLKHPLEFPFVYVLIGLVLNNLLWAFLAWWYLNLP